MLFWDFTSEIQDHNDALVLSPEDYVQLFNFNYINSISLPLSHPLTCILNFSVRAQHMEVAVETLSSCSHLKVDEDGLHVLWTQDLLQRDHVILQNI